MNHEEHTRLYLVRHGELTTSREGLFVGHRDVSLNVEGVCQIRKLSDHLRDVHLDCIISSDLSRTRQSAEIIAKNRDIEPVSNESFREINLGAWEGMSLKEIMQTFADEFEQRSEDIVNYRIDNGESFDDVSKRALPCLKAILAGNPGKQLALVAHGGVNRVILCDALGLDLRFLDRLDQSYACLNIIDFYPDISVVKLLNATYY